MATLKDIIIYIFKKYPNPEELSKPRLVKIIYLVDWRACLSISRPITDIQWFFNHYGPYVDDVISLIKSEPTTFRVQSYGNPYGGSTDKIQLLDHAKYYEENISKTEREIIDLVIEKTYGLSWNDFISVVYSTYPVKNSSKYTSLDLRKLAQEYKSSKVAQAKAQ